MPNGTPKPDHADTARCLVSRTGADLLLAFTGNWDLRAVTVDPGEVLSQLRSAPKPARVRFDTAGLAAWDSRLLVFCRPVMVMARKMGVGLDTSGLPDGARRLLELTEKVPDRTNTAVPKHHGPFLAWLGGRFLDSWQGVPHLLEFVGDVVLACLNMARGRAVFQPSGLLLLIRQVGVDALPIVSLISLLVGLILAFVASIQLLQFGAQIYVATIVGIAMIRVMGAIMTGIIMAGRTGAAFAAELGTMQVNEEIDALRTFGFSPTEFLVMPRMLALVLMMPLLCVYADLMGVLGGFLVGVGMLGINPDLYLTQTFKSVPLVNLWIGLAHSVVFGILVALAGCYRGMRCGRSAMGVGQATTSAVVTGILSIVLATALITWLCNILGL
jgi:phospholipid/cholesterol/gamma-HCH transport system permease protein